jgi:hypothetical protein
VSRGRPCALGLFRSVAMVLALLHSNSNLDTPDMPLFVYLL